MHPLPGIAGIVHPDHGVRVRNVLMTGADLAPRVALERGEPEMLLPLVAKDELYARGAEAAGAVVKQQRRVTA